MDNKLHYTCVMSHACNPSDREAETYDYLGLALQTTQLILELWVRVKDPISERGKGQLKKISKVNL